MSIWGPNPQDNDDASDWLDELADEPTVAFIDEALDGVLSPGPDDYCEVTECAQAVAAAVVVAELADPRPPFVLVDDETLRLLREEFDVMSRVAQDALRERAYRSLHVVLDERRSELLDLMRESSTIEVSWRRLIDATLARLSP